MAATKPQKQKSQKCNYKSVRKHLSCTALATNRYPVNSCIIKLSQTKRIYRKNSLKISIDFHLQNKLRPSVLPLPTRLSPHPGCINNFSHYFCASCCCCAVVVVVAARNQITLMWAQFYSFAFSRFFYLFARLCCCCCCWKIYEYKEIKISLKIPNNKL